ncbi:MAG: hypothetical protein U0Z44_19225 [Kouleothrix sp.]
MPVISAIPGVGHALQSWRRVRARPRQAIDPSAPAFTDGRFGLVAGFYHATVPPLAIILVLLMIVGPLLGWRDTSMPPAAHAALAGARGRAGGLRGRAAWRARSVAAAGLYRPGRVRGRHHDCAMIVRTLRGGWLRIGGYLAHVGLAVLLTGVVGLELLRHARAAASAAAGPED